MSRRTALGGCLGVLSLLVVARCVPFLAADVRFDSDQAVVGLMAKHISEGRAFPVFFYGQSYLLAVEAYLAAPVMWALGPTEAALKLPILLMNIALALLLAWRAYKDLALPAWLGVVATLPVAVPPIVPGTRFMEAMGGNVVTLLYAVLFWIARGRPWRLGLLAGIAVAQRELALFPLAALFVLDVATATARVEAVSRWMRTAAGMALVLATIALMRPHGAMFGPGTVARSVNNELTSQRVLLAQAECIDPAQWPTRLGALVGEHMPLMFGGHPESLQIASVNTGVGQGNPGLMPWVTCLIGLALAVGVRRRSAAPFADAPGAGAAPRCALPWYLALTALISTAVYALVACSAIAPNTLRYNLLLMLLPVGALMAGLRAPSAAMRAGLATGALLWAWLSVTDYLALAREIRGGAWPHERLAVIGDLEARGIRALRGEYRLAYALSFLSQERVTVAPLAMSRIDEYETRAGATPALIKHGACANGELLRGDIWLCPPR